MDMSLMRKEKGMKQRDVAKILGVDRTTVSKWETGENCPHSKIFPKLAETYGCTTDELFELLKKSAPESA